MICSAALSTPCRSFGLAAVQLVYHTVMQLNSMLSAVAVLTRFKVLVVQVRW